jgi:hypothetical protein
MMQSPCRIDIVGVSGAWSPGASFPDSITLNLSGDANCPQVDVYFEAAQVPAVVIPWQGGVANLTIPRMIPLPPPQTGVRELWTKCGNLSVRLVCTGPQCETAAELFIDSYNREVRIEKWWDVAIKVVVNFIPFAGPYCGWRKLFRR